MLAAIVLAIVALSPAAGAALTPLNGSPAPRSAGSLPPASITAPLPPCPPVEPDEGGAAAVVQPHGPALAAGSLAAPSLQLSPASDTGVSSSDQLTGNNMPTFEGQAPARSRVGLFVDGVLTGFPKASGAGRWSYMLNECRALADGTHTIAAQAFDTAGEVSSLSPVLTIRILTRAPDMPVITAPAANSRAQAGALVVAGTAAPGTTVTVLDGSAALASVQTDAGGAWRATLAGLADGAHTLRASATDAAGNISPAFNDTLVTVGTSGAGGGAAAGTASAADSTTSGASTTSSTTSSPVIAMAAGDIACGTGSTGAACDQPATAKLLTANNPNVVMVLGDNQYECGLLSDYQTYYDSSWGAVKPQTHPSIGNHEYFVSTTSGNPCYNAPSGAPGYFTYFGNAATPLQPGCTSGCNGYYSYDVGGWHFVVINGQCNQIGGCGLGSPEETWLKNDLAAHPAACTIAYWHFPRYSSGYSGTTYLNSLSAFWQDLYNAGVELVLNGHDHDYERFAPMNANGNIDNRHGIREFIVGTGGRNFTAFSTTIAANSQVRNNTAFGVLKLALGSGSYSWQFLPIPGQSFSDSGSAKCH